MTTRRFRDWIVPLLCLSLLGPAALGAPLPADDSLWVSDDANVTIYNIALDGTMLSSFHSGSISGLALSIDPVDGSIWGAKEGSNLVVNLATDGTVLSSFSGLTYDPLASAPEGVAVDFIDGTLWLVDDATNLVYHVQRDGTLISSFPFAMVDPAATSPQGIAYDPLTDTLWFTDNGTDSIYNATREGLLLSVIHVAAFNPAATNLQGIGVDMIDGTIWVTDRPTDGIFNITRNGVLLGTIVGTGFGSENPTGVASERGEAATLESVKAQIAAAVAAGEISAKALKHINHVYKLVDKQLAKDHPQALASMLYGLKDFFVGKIASGEVEEADGVLIAMSLISASCSYNSL